jgi:cytosine/adenosine deaminase-related metal-dependent hydrolase
VQYVTGKLLTEDGFVPGHIGFEDGLIREIGRGQRRDALAKGLILPPMFNAHTHLGDSFLRTRFRSYRGERTIPALFAPPSGFKHRELRRASRTVMAAGVRRALLEMRRTGASGFCDFREGGLRGLAVMNDARCDLDMRGIVLGRPSGLVYDRDEVDALLKVCDGIGVSAITDWEYPELQRLAAHARGAGKLFALHASEVFRESIDKVLDLRPSFLVHLIKAEEFDYERVAAEKIPVVVCPAANAFFGLRPRIDLMMRFGIDVALGTDNGMLSPPRMLSAVQAGWEISRQGGLAPMDILLCALQGFRKILNGPEGISFREGSTAELFVVGNPELYAANDPAAALVSGGSRARVTLSLPGRERTRTR